MNRSMTSKERVKIAFSRQLPDRVPINYMANPDIDQRLKAHFNLRPDDDEGLRKSLGVDFRGIAAKYVGPQLHKKIPGRNVDPLWGWITRYITHETGGYWDYCDFPLRDADEEKVANWPMPSPDNFNYSQIAEFCKMNKEYAVYVGSCGLACVQNPFLRGMDQMYIDLALDNPAGLLLLDRMLAIQLEKTYRELEAAKGGVDFMWIGEDLGSQHCPLISMEMLRKHILHRHKPFFSLAHSFNIPVMMHTCGSSSWAYDEYIKMGVSVVDTLQPEAKDMSPEYLKKRFGDRLAFHGCISTAGPIVHGTVSDVITYCRRTLEIMMPGGGYCFAPTHDLQDNSITENVIAMYETAHIYGVY